MVERGVKCSHFRTDFILSSGEAGARDLKRARSADGADGSAWMQCEKSFRLQW